MTDSHLKWLLPPPPQKKRSCSFKAWSKAQCLCCVICPFLCCKIPGWSCLFYVSPCVCWPRLSCLLIPWYRGQFTCLRHPTLCYKSLPSAPPSLAVSVRANLLPAPPATIPLQYAAKILVSPLVYIVISYSVCGFVFWMMMLNTFSHTAAVRSRDLPLLAGWYQREITWEEVFSDIIWRKHTHCGLWLYKPKGVPAKSQCDFTNTLTVTRVPILANEYQCKTGHALD